MTIQETNLRGFEAVDMATRLLQRCRLSHPHAGVFEAADVQWSWRIPRDSDDVQKVFWMDNKGPVAGIWLTSTSDGRWQLDPIIDSQANGITAQTVWERAMTIVANHPSWTIVIPVADDDAEFQKLAKASGLIVSDQDFTGWMNAENKPGSPRIADGFQLVDRSQRDTAVHPMTDRSGDHIATRLKECSIYNPTLDLSIETDEGEIAGYSLYWLDPVTNIGLVEPVRVHEDFQRKGLARVMVANGINRLVAMGAERIKVSWETEAAGALYLGLGFQQQSTTSWYSTPKS